jgi:hypothetical protein|tara:strand:+ start:558 stop:767 length:210 start_codon:yes stop_codon:yes gene_type:complete
MKPEPKQTPRIKPIAKPPSVKIAVNIYVILLFKKVGTAVKSKVQVSNMVNHHQLLLIATKKSKPMISQK